MPNHYHNARDFGPQVWREEVRGGYPDPGLIALSGRERLESWRRRVALAPPLFHLTGAIPTGFGTGTADAQMPASSWLAVSSGLIPGGALAILADIAFGCAVETELPPATPYTTAELSLTFLRPARPGTTVTAHGQALHVGGSVGFSEAFVLEAESERLLAHGTSRLTIFPALDDPPEPPAALPMVEPDRGDGTPDPYLRPPPGDIVEQKVWDELPGIEILRGQLAGELPAPPLHHLTGIRPLEIADGNAVFAMPASEWLASPARLLQGGTVAMLADVAMLGAVQTTTPAGVAFAGIDLKTNFLRPVQPDGSELLARAEVVHRGRRIAITRATVTNEEGKAVMLATGSSMYLPGRPMQLGEVEISAAEDQ